MKFLLDTCVVSDFFKKDPGVFSRFERETPVDFAISSITVMEIEYGLFINPDRATKLKPLWHALVRQIHILNYTQEDAYVTAQIRSYLKAKGTPISPFDVLLGGMALQRDLIFVTSNTKEFQRIPQLHLENWRV